MITKKGSQYIHQYFNKTYRINSLHQRKVQQKEFRYDNMTVIDKN
jgi:hypothetical protein